MDPQSDDLTSALVEPGDQFTPQQSLQGQDDTGQEGQEGELPSEERLRAYLDQVLLRLWNASPALACYKESDRIVPGAGTIEVSFFKLPDEILAGVEEVFGVPNVETLAYTKQGQACIGFRVKPSAQDLSALAVDDAADHDPVQSEKPDDESPDELIASADGIDQKPQASV